jgi:hypothetical protein
VVIIFLNYYHGLSEFLQLSKLLGNDKPDVLVKIERLLWECLIAIATGKEHIYKAMNNFISKVDWEEIAMVSEGDRAHFADSRFSV